MPKKSTKKSIEKKTEKKSTKASPAEKKKSERKADASVLFSELKSKKLLKAIFIVLLLMLLLIIINFISLVKTRQELRTYLEAAKMADDHMPDKIINSSPANSWVGMGDLFSSYAYVDSDKSDMELDDLVTSFVFPPIYSLEKTGDYNEDILNDDSWIITEEKNSCQFSRNCLEVNGNRVIYNGREIDLPLEIQTENILRIDSSFLSSKFVLSFIVEHEEEERAYAYFFDGRRYSVIIGKNSDEKIITQYGRPGIAMVAGGSDDNFILLYSGYEAKAFHYLNGELEDISKYFGLRVASRGFYPYIIKQGSGNNSLWYVLSLDEKKIKLVKLWQNGSSRIMGAYDFSPIFSDFSALNLLAFKELDSERGEIEFLFSSDSNIRTLGPKDAGVYRFKDMGFDNSKSRRVYSLNLNTGKRNISKAFIENLHFNSGYGDNASEGYPTISFVDDSGVKQGIRIGEEISFNENNKELYYEFVFPPNASPEYSPWFFHINHLHYFLQ